MMSDTFNLPVKFNDTEAEYPIQILRYGFTHKVLVTVKGIPVTFEPDEEGSYRAVIDPAITEQISPWQSIKPIFVKFKA